MLSYRDLLGSLLSLIYPPSCLHCGDGVGDAGALFCPVCESLLELLDSNGRCSYCFSPGYCPHGHACSACAHLGRRWYRAAAVFDYVGPAASIVKRLKYGDQPYLAKGAGAYLAAQLVLLEWPMPDLIVPVPIAWTHLLDRGYNQSLLLAEALGAIIQRPVKSALRRKAGDYSQAGLNHGQRQLLSADRIALKKEHGLQDKCILLVDDVSTTGTTLQRCAEVLLEGCPASIYALVLCRPFKESG